MLSGLDIFPVTSTYNKTYPIKQMSFGNISLLPCLCTTANDCISTGFESGFIT